MKKEECNLTSQSFGKNSGMEEESKGTNISYLKDRIKFADKSAVKFAFPL
jgi:hypothetical protein